VISAVLDLEVGKRGRILDIRGGRAVKQRLYDLGLTTGTEITLLDKSPFTGPILLLVRGSSLAIGRGIAAKIIVRYS
jgi:DtxR family Mn-dependent transcriptional regulator